jgi:hypothetical protein
MLERAVNKIEGVPSDVRNVMKMALKSALDFVMTDINPNSDDVPYFADLIPNIAFNVGEVLQESLGKMDFTNKQMIGEVLEGVGAEFANPDYWQFGPNFANIVDLPAIVLLEQDQVNTLMTAVRDGVLAGAEKVVTDLAMEKRYQYAALNALYTEMQVVGMQFEQFRDSKGGKGGAGDLGFWEPKAWNKAVCCMDGMDCWTGKFANAAGRANLEKDIERFTEQEASAKELYDELNADNLAKAAARRQEELADARLAANKIINSIADSEKRKSKRAAEINTLQGTATDE